MEGFTLAAATSAASQPVDPWNQSGAMLMTYPEPYGIATMVPHAPSWWMTSAPDGSDDVLTPETASTDPMDASIEAKGLIAGTLVQLPEVFVDVP